MLREKEMKFNKNIKDENPSGEEVVDLSSKSKSVNTLLNYSDLFDILGL